MALKGMSSIIKIYAEASILRTHASGGTKCGGSLKGLLVDMALGMAFSSYNNEVYVFHI